MTHQPVEMTPEQAAEFVERARQVMIVNFERQHTPWYRLRERRDLRREVRARMHQLVLDLYDAGRAPKP